MRHKYSTEAVVLGRIPFREAGATLALLTEDLGFVYARAEGVRRSGARLSHALQTLAHTEVTLVRGKEGWRLTGAVLSRKQPASLSYPGKQRAARVSGLLQRLVGHEVQDERLYADFRNFLKALETEDETALDAAESLAALRLLSYLGFDAGEAPPEGYLDNALAFAQEHRKQLIERINRGIIATGL